jgi:phosphatidate phosphatase APP1
MYSVFSVNMICILMSFTAIYFQSEDAELKAEVLENSVLENVPIGVENEDEDDADETKSIANSVMSESSIKSIHSKKSLSELISKARGRMMVMATIEEEGEDAISPPVVSTVTDDNGARMAEKKSIHKLAFKNRNPSI